jgi:hypothetical protein
MNDSPNLTIFEHRLFKLVDYKNALRTYHIYREASKNLNEIYPSLPSEAFNDLFNRSELQTLTLTFELTPLSTDEELFVSIVPLPDEFEIKTTLFVDYQKLFFEHLQKLMTLQRSPSL